VAALARAGADAVGDDVDAKLESLLPRVKGDDEARQEFVDLLELLGPDDPRTATYRRRLTTALY
jgi:putative thioredoxin